MDVIILAVEFDKLSLKIQTDFCEDFAEFIEGCLGQDSTTIFRYEDQMHVHHEDAVPAVS